jgi:hypothetical protein
MITGEHFKEKTLEVRRPTKKKPLTRGEKQVLFYFLVFLT